MGVKGDKMTSASELKADTLAKNLSTIKEITMRKIQGTRSYTTQ